MVRPIEAAVGLVLVDVALELLGVDLGQGGVGDRQVAAGDFVVQRALGDQVVEDRLLRFRRLEHLLVELGAEHLAIAVHLLALRRFPFLLGDFLSVHVGDRIGVVALVLVAADADENERRHDQQHQENLHQALVGTNKFKHGQPILVERMRLNCRHKKRRTLVRLFLQFNAGGADGTRTRDPRRDRPVF